MGSTVFDARMLEKWERDTRQFISKECPKEARKFMNEEGKKARRYLKKATQRKTVTRTGALLKGIEKRSAKRIGQTYSVEVRNEAEHASLVEYGHKLVAWGKETDRRTTGRYPARLAKHTMYRTFQKDADEWVDKMIKELCR